jgi:signal transduction histidine kinase
VPHPDGSLAGVVIIISNITQFRKIEQIKSQFISMVAHELKTPLAAIQGFLNILLDENLHIEKKTQTDYLNRSVIRLKNMILLVNDLLDISRMEVKTKQREIEEINLVEVIDNTIQLLELESQKKKILIEKYFEKGLPRINADQNEITRLITNLLSNAIKYNTDNGKISISANVQKNYVTIRIQDTGIGMKPEEKSKLFNEFYRAKNDRTRGISGTGLGLTIVKRIVDSYQGKIEVESEFGIGTTFLVNLPINAN